MASTRTNVATTYASVTCALILAVYLPLTQYRFAFSDDYAYLVIAAYRAVNPFFLGDGRPLGGLLAHGLFSAVTRVEDTWVLRLLGQGFFLASAFLIQRAAVLNGFQPIVASLIACLLAVVAPVQNWMVWGVSAWQMPALLCGILAYFAGRRVVDDQGGYSVRHAAIFMILIFVGNSIYQPFTTAVCALALLEIATSRGRPFVVRRWVSVLAIYLGTLAVYFVVFKFFYLSFVPPIRHNRVQLVTLETLPAKLDWFVRYPVMLAFSPGFTYVKPWISYGFMGLATIGLALWARSMVRFLLLIALSMGVLVLAHLPSILPVEGPPTRTQVSIALVGVVLIGLSVEALAKLTQLSSDALHLTIGATCIGLLVASGARAVVVTAKPQELEYRRIERTLDSMRLPPEGKLVVVGPLEGTSLGQGYCGPPAMTGCVSAQWQFALPNMVRLWMRSRGINDRKYLIYYIRSENDATAALFEPDITTYGPVPKDAMTIDFRDPILRPSQTQ
jgi:hypothetical protein